MLQGQLGNTEGKLEIKYDDGILHFHRCHNGFASWISKPLF